MTESAPNWLSLAAMLITPLQILVVDLLLSADNALVIALASQGLPSDQMRVTALLGTAGAVGLRLAMATAGLALLQVPSLKFIAGVALLGIAIRLTAAPHDRLSRAALEEGRDLQAPAFSLLASVAAIVVADAIMSLDNVVAVAMLANGNLILLGFGLALSIPMLIWGGLLIRRFLDEHPLVILASGMFLGWLAGGIGVSDPFVAPWIEANAPALPLVVPLACAVFVLWQSVILTSGRDLREGRDAG